MGNTGRNNVWYHLSLLSQLAISFLTPILMMIFICLWLKKTFGLGNWIVIGGMLLGLGSGLSTVWAYMKKSMKDAEIQRQKYKDRYR